MLAARLMQELDLELIALNVKSPFCLCDRQTSGGCLHSAGLVAKNLGIKLISNNVAEEMFEIVKHPKHGYGANMNPCIDCRILLFKKAKALLEKEGASFVITGEVLAQRPMSQHKQALKMIEEESGLEGLVLRPLSAKLLPETIPEKCGWVKRSKLLNFNGRSRKPQIELARNFNLKDYPCAAGGCLLTDPGFTRRMRDLLKYGQLDLKAIELLKVGRHFRVSSQAKLVVGRDEKENSRIFDLAAEGDYLFAPEDIKGPTALGRGVFNQNLITLSCRIVLRYCDLNGNKTGAINYKRGLEKPQIVSEVVALEEEKLLSFRI